MQVCRQNLGITPPKKALCLSKIKFSESTWWILDAWKTLLLHGDSLFLSPIFQSPFIQSVFDVILSDSSFSHKYFFFIPAAGLRSRTWRQLQIFGAACAGRSGNPGECLFVRRGQVDHEEDAVRHILLGAAAGELLPPAASEGGQQLAVLLRVLQVLQSDHIGQVQLSVQAEASSAPADVEAEDAEEDEEEGGGCYGDVGDRANAEDGLA